MTPQLARLSVALAPALFAKVDASTTPVQAEVKAELCCIADEVGVSTEPGVRLELTESSTADRLVRLFVDDQPCGFPDHFIGQALAYVKDSAEVLYEREAVLEQLNGAGGEQLGKFLASVCRAALSVQPSVLCSPGADRETSALLDLGISIARRDALPPGPASTESDQTEETIAALAPRISVYVEPEYLRSLSYGDAVPEQVRLLREGVFAELGLQLPGLHMVSDASLPPRGFSFALNDVRTLPQINLPANTVLANSPPEIVGLLGIEVRPTFNPESDRTGALVSADNKRTLEDQGFTVWDPLGFLVVNLKAAVRVRAHALMTRDVAASMMRSLGRAFPFLESEARTHISADRLAYVLRELLRDQVPIRNLRRVLELLLRNRVPPPSDGPVDDLLLVRAGLADVIAAKAAGGATTLPVYLLDPALEEAVGRHAREDASRSDDVPQRVLAMVREAISLLPSTHPVPALLTKDEVRRPLADLLRYEFPRLHVLSHSEVPPSHNLRPVDRIGLS